MKNKVIVLACFFGATALFGAAPAPQAPLPQPTIIQINEVMQLLAHREAAAYAAAGNPMPMPATVYDNVTQAIGGANFDKVTLKRDPTTNGMILDLEQTANAAGKQTFNFSQAEMNATIPLIQQALPPQPVVGQNNQDTDDSPKKKKYGDTTDDDSDEKPSKKSSSGHSEASLTTPTQTASQTPALNNANPSKRQPSQQRPIPQIQQQPVQKQPAPQAVSQNTFPGFDDDFFFPPASYNNQIGNTQPAPTRQSLGTSAATITSQKKESPNRDKNSTQKHQVTQVREKVTTQESTTINHRVMPEYEPVQSRKKSLQKGIKITQEKNDIYGSTEAAKESAETFIQKIIKSFIHFISWVYTTFIGIFI